MAELKGCFVVELTYDSPRTVHEIALYEKLEDIDFGFIKYQIGVSADLRLPSSRLEIRFDKDRSVDDKPRYWKYSERWGSHYTSNRKD